MTAPTALIDSVVELTALVAVGGDFKPVLDVLDHIQDVHGDQGFFSALFSLAGTAAKLGFDMQQDELLMIDAPDGIDSAPPGLRAGVRFLTAAGADDTAQALALFYGMPDDRARGEFVATLIKSSHHLLADLLARSKR